ncbi:MAG TPA: hypothetical protein VFS56_02170 [Gemmatimonadaceae bacterium]|nr:hypothetical protein [Gemmatimonadaceae bacterium]
MKKINRLLRAGLTVSATVSTAATMHAQARLVEPVLAAPEAGLDDPASYQGYQTRFFRDAKGNVVQIYLDARSGRVVNLFGNAVNESVGFTVRDAAGRPLRLEWGSTGATVSDSGARRSIEYQLIANAPRIEIGWILLGSMRVERDLQYSDRHRQPFGEETFRQRELAEMIASLERLEPAEQERHLQLLNASYISDVRARLSPDVVTRLGGGIMGPNRTVVATQAALDGKTSLQLDLGAATNAAVVVTWPAVSIRARDARPIRLTVRVTTDAPALTPLSREQIFNADFIRFLADRRTAADRVTRAGAARARTAAESVTVARYRRLERDIRGLELLSSREKLMAGLPNYATYFGRDMMMSALMLEPVASPAVAEHVIASVLRKLGPAGDVSHEEALGGQAIRENAAEYNALVAEHLRLRERGDRAAAATAITRARSVLADLQKVRENYNMLDDEFQLPVLTARYLANPAIPASRKLAFMIDSSDGAPRVALLLRELGLVARLAEPYARDPAVLNLVASPPLDSSRWRSVSWRDSNAGYANGRFAMDINAIWVPHALESLSEILSRLRSIGFTQARLNALTSGPAQAALGAFARDSALLRRAVETWNGAEKHFVVTLPATEVRARVLAKAESLPAAERAYWIAVLSSSGADREPFEFLAISLDATGRPIPVVNTDPATALFLADRTAATASSRQRALRDVRAFMRAYPVGLLVGQLGPVVANDAYASPVVWQAFERDLYHSPRVVWGREVNLIMLGLAKQIAASVDAAGRPRDPALASYVTELRDALRRTTASVEASGLKHNELWSYQIEGTPPRLKPVRYGASTDIQLWNVTDLAVQFVLSRLAQPPTN